MVKIFIFLFFVTNSAFAYISDPGPEIRKNESLIAITQELFNQHSSCLHSMVNAPHSPVFTKTYFQSLPDSSVLTLKCEELNSDARFNFVFISDKDVLLLDLPKYIAKDFSPNRETIQKEYPREVVHFFYQGKDFYLDLEGQDMGKIKTPSDLSQLAFDLKVSKNKLINDFVGKFETYLKSRHLYQQTHLRVASDTEREVVMKCLTRKHQNVLSIYLQSEIQAKLPGIDQMQRLLTDRNLGQVPREPYLHNWEDLEASFQIEFYKNNPSCVDVIKQDKLIHAFSSNLSNHKKYYVEVRQRLAKEEVLILGRAAE